MTESEQLQDIIHKSKERQDHLLQIQRDVKLAKGKYEAETSRLRAALDAERAKVAGLVGQCEKVVAFIESGEDDHLLRARLRRELVAVLRAAKEGTVPVQPDKQDAVERAKELLHVVNSKLPPLARGFRDHLASRLGLRLGLCIEVCLTAFAAYAQCVEGLPCDDVAYVASPTDSAWFAARSGLGGEGTVPT